MPLRRRASSRLAGEVNRLTVVIGKSRIEPRFSYGSKKISDGDGVMTDIGAANPNAGVATISRLADRLAAVTPPPPVLELTNPVPLPRPSPAVAAALATTRAIAARADRNGRRSRSITGLMVGGFVALCSFIPYALVALVLRLAIARVFFLDGQTRIADPRADHAGAAARAILRAARGQCARPRSAGGDGCPARRHHFDLAAGAAAL